MSDPPSCKAILEIIREDKSISKDVREVLEKWYSDISKLYSGVRENPDLVFDNDFLENAIAKKQLFESLSSAEQSVSSHYCTSHLNAPLSLNEVSKVVDKCKLHKAYLYIPNEALKNKNAKILLHKFFSFCFDTGFSPTDWNYSDIKPSSEPMYSNV